MATEPVVALLFFLFYKKRHKQNVINIQTTDARPTADEPVIVIGL